MIRRIMCLPVILSALCGALIAQTAPTTGLRDNTPSVNAFTNARIIVAPHHVIAKGTLVIRNGLVEAVGENVQPPADARVWNMEGRTIYPSFIDLYSDYGLPKADEQAGNPFESPAAPEKPKGAAHWNQKVRAEFDASAEFQPDPKAAEKLRSQGFGLVLATPQRGLFRGWSALVALGDGAASDLVIRQRVAQTTSLDQSRGSFREYPTSLMGVIALHRQTWIDADWYQKAQESYAKNPDQPRPETNIALEALQSALHGEQPVVMDATTDLNFLRAAKIGKEFGLKLWIRGSGEEYRKIDAIKETQVPVIVTLNFPDAPNVDTPEEALGVSLEELHHWDAAPENPGRLKKAGIPIVLSASQLKDPGAFLAQARKAIERGLDADDALACLTTVPAEWLGLEQEYGSLDKGKRANFVVTDGDIFGEKTKLSATWIDGKQYEVKPPPVTDPRGTWSYESNLSTSKEMLTLRGDAEKPTGFIKFQSKDIRLSSAAVSADRLTLTFAGDSAGHKGIVRMSASVGEKDLFGIGELPDGQSFKWSATRVEPPRVEPDTAKPKKVEMASFPEVTPPVGFGRAKIPDQPEYVLVKNGTIWTEGKGGIVEHGDILIKKGKIVQVGTNITAPNDAVIVDATGKHVSPGIIDCHSHTAISQGINEGAQAVTCEVRIQDVLNSDDIWIYRQLAGGTTIANVLHGSANPIGGQTIVVKWRWGALPDQLPIAGALPGVKFALGENVKQSNGFQAPRSTARYPQTRMGVEQIIRDRFMAALDYEKAMKNWERDKSKIPPHRDLELDALVEVLNGKRLIHSHCYRQDEILMLMKVAEDFGIRIATLQHVMEGYKIADEIAKHGAGGSTFSDWWAYKIEAWDAIPGNGPLMHDRGVVVSYNSDDNQQATRLNWEAAKAIRFGISEEEALKFVTINPAKQLRIDDKVGSLEEGKDADFVVWSGDPLSTYSKCEQTWVDGRKYFDVKEDLAMRTEIEKERAVLIQKVLASKKESGPAANEPNPRFRRPRDNDDESSIDELIAPYGGEQ